MSISKPEKQESLKPINRADTQMRAIAYSLDTLIPGFYIWLVRSKFGLEVANPKKAIRGQFTVQLALL